MEIYEHDHLYTHTHTKRTHFKAHVDLMVCIKNILYPGKIERKKSQHFNTIRKPCNKMYTFSYMNKNAWTFMSAILARLNG